MILFALALIVNSIDPAPGGPVLTHDFARLTGGEAAALVGRRKLYRIKLDSAEVTEGRFILYECQTVNAVARTVWLYAGQDVADEMTVEATLVVLYHAASVGDKGTRFPGFTEYRLKRAIRRE